MPARAAPLDLVEEVVSVGRRELLVLRPRSSEALLDEEAFEREEFLPYWAELWPSALALAAVVAERPLDGTRVLELGCGLALPSLAAASAGARVLATDWSPDAVSLAALNARRNGLEIETAVASWERPDRLIPGAPWPLVLASDVLYELRNVDVLLALLPNLVDARSEVLLSDPGRPGAKRFFETARQNWHVDVIEGARRSNVTVYALRKRAVTAAATG